jgi:hypothetical protein
MYLLKNWLVNLLLYWLLHLLSTVWVLRLLKIGSTYWRSLRRVLRYIFYQSRVFINSSCLILNYLCCASHWTLTITREWAGILDSLKMGLIGQGYLRYIWIQNFILHRELVPETPHQGWFSLVKVWNFIRLCVHSLWVLFNYLRHYCLVDTS